MIGPKSGLGVMQPVNGQDGERDLSYYTNGGIGDLGFDWGEFFGGISKEGLKIAGNLTDPRFNPGTYSRVDAAGNQIIYSQPAGSTGSVFQTLDSSSNNQSRLGVNATGNGGLDTTTLLLIGAGVLLLVMFMNRR